MKKNYAFFTVTIVAFALVVGCSGFKGFCDRGSLFPTRQPQLVPTQSVYQVQGDACCPPEMMMSACDAPCGAVGSNVSYPGPIVDYR